MFFSNFSIPSSYINLQDAYAVEANNIGDWGQIGYSAPGEKLASNSYQTTNFTYGDAASGDSRTWTAISRVALNDCSTNGSWVITANPKSNSSTKNTYIEYATSGTQACIDLTPAFTKLARTGEQ